MESHSRVEVLTGILLVTRDGATKAKIMSESSLTPSHVDQCLCFLQDSGLLQRGEVSGVFRPTRKGARLIGDYERINQKVEGRLVGPLTS